MCFYLESPHSGCDVAILDVLNGFLGIFCYLLTKISMYVYKKSMLVLVPGVTFAKKGYI